MATPCRPLADASIARQRALYDRQAMDFSERTPVLSRSPVSPMKNLYRTLFVFGSAVLFGGCASYITPGEKADLPDFR